jgi:signal transduction histidine kinase/ActR/RegA family two-component response regulator
MAIGPVTTKKRGRNLERFDIVLTVLLAGWVPSILMLLVSYTTLKKTLESKILRDRQTFVQLIGHLVDDDLASTASIVSYYQTLPGMERLFAAPIPQDAAQQWIAEKFFSYPRIDGMFVAAADGRLLGTLPAAPNLRGQPFHPHIWKDGADRGPSTYVSPVHQRPVDGRMVTDVVGAVRTRDGKTIGYIGASILIERIGRRLSSISFTDHTVCQIVDQQGFPLFTADFKSETKPSPPAEAKLISHIQKEQSGHLSRDGNIYSFEPLESAQWLAIIRQPEEIAYAPVHDLLRKITVPAGWLIAGTLVAAILAGRFYRRQAESARRIEREVSFNQKILANMPIGIALVDPETRRFLHVNDAFAQMALQIGQLPAGTDIGAATYDQIKIVSPTIIENVLATGRPYQLIEEPFRDRTGATRFCNINLLRLLDSHQHIQGVLYFVEEKTRDMTLRNELLSANAAKDQFLALLSHELRNPLSPVIAMVAALETHVADSAEVRQALDVIRRNVELEARLIDDLLDITRIAKGKLKLSLEPVSVHNVLQRALEICREEISQKALEIELNLNAHDHFVQGDPARLQQVFWNLIKNSVKFTDGGGRVSLATSNRQPGQIEIDISDTGIGIEADKVSKIFTAFEQGQSSITRKFGGLGLGLAISKAMVLAHGGIISASSPGPNRGATFSVRLGTIAEPAVQDGESPPNGAEPVAKPVSATRPPRLLVVDDHEDTCTGMKLILERRGYDITIAYTADQAVEKARQENFDLLISDIGLPDRSGYELMQEMRGRGVPGIALSGFGMEHDVNRARAAGFSEHLTKPINFERLEEVIQQLLGNSVEKR